ncbi:MAG: GTPase Era [Oscillospiraceae bacterium]
MEQTYHAFIAIVGKPNVGKSSLMNALMGEKIAIVTDKPQTTRTRITGVLTEGAYQYVFLDTPGYHKPRTKLSEHMVDTVQESVADVDLVLFMTDADGDRVVKSELELLERLQKDGANVVLLINKIDKLLEKSRLISRIQQYDGLCDFAAVVPISVEENDGLDAVMEEIKPFAVEGVHYFPDDTLTDQPEKVIAAEMIREQLLRHLNQEIPHGTAVVIESMKERPDGSVMDVQAEIYCEKASHKGIIIGKGGVMLKAIASESRKELESFLDTHVNLQCWVKVRDDWRNNERFMKNFGL